jgi:peptidoglycan hydrolase-like protein with peptidoglycan-binding domain
MLTILAGVVGLLGSFLPSLLNFFTAKANDAYQLQVLQLQMQAAAQNLQIQLQIQDDKASIEQQQLLYSYDNGPSGSKFIDALKSSIRPVITYVIFSMWVGVETIGFYHGLVVDKKTAIEVVPIIWDANTQSIFFAIIGFWFGSRMLEKYGMYPPLNQPKITPNSPGVQAATDPNNIAAVKAFQAAHGLVVDGVVGTQTLNAMNKEKKQ